MINQSENITELAVALSIAQGQIEGAEKNAKNPFHKNEYANLEAVWDVIRKPLSNNGLSAIQLTAYIDQQLCIVTRILHKSGQWIEGYYPLLANKQNDPQALGSATTYARRYALCAALGVVQVDDDGNLGAGKHHTETEKAAIKENNGQTNTPNISEYLKQDSTPAAAMNFQNPPQQKTGKVYKYSKQDCTHRNDLAWMLSKFDPNGEYCPDCGSKRMKSIHEEVLPF